MNTPLCNFKISVMLFSHQQHFGSIRHARKLMTLLGCNHFTSDRAATDRQDGLHSVVLEESGNMLSLVPHEQQVALDVMHVYDCCRHHLHTCVEPAGG